jgi:hypothetical protein
LAGELCVWDAKGFKEETVFGKRDDEVMEESDEDCDKVKQAISTLDKYIRP